MRRLLVPRCLPASCGAPQLRIKGFEVATGSCSITTKASRQRNNLLSAPKRHLSKDASQSKKSKATAETANRWSYRYPLRQRLSAAWKGHQPPIVDPHLAEKAAAKLLRRPEKAAELLANLPMEQRRVIALSWALTELEEEFTKADKDLDGKLSYAEFKEWVHRVIEAGKERDDKSRPTRRQLWQAAMATSVPFIGFGAVDNGLMVIYGDVIDSTLGVYLGASMLASAALGNAISNIFGMLLHGSINKGADKLGLPDPRLTLSQRKLPEVHYWTTFGSTVGVFTGCLLGMAPLLFMNQTAKEEQRAAAKHH